MVVIVFVLDWVVETAGNNNSICSCSATGTDNVTHTAAFSIANDTGDLAHVAS